MKSRCLFVFSLVIILVVVLQTAMAWLQSSRSKSADVPSLIASLGYQPQLSVFDSSRGRRIYNIKISGDEGIQLIYRSDTGEAMRWYGRYDIRLSADFHSSALFKVNLFDMYGGPVNWLGVAISKIDLNPYKNLRASCRFGSLVTLDYSFRERYLTVNIEY